MKKKSGPIRASPVPKGDSPYRTRAGTWPKKPGAPRGADEPGGRTDLGLLVRKEAEKRYSRVPGLGLRVVKRPGESRPGSYAAGETVLGRGYKHCGRDRIFFVEWRIQHKRKSGKPMAFGTPRSIVEIKIPKIIQARRFACGDLSPGNPLSRGQAAQGIPWSGTGSR